MTKLQKLLMIISFVVILLCLGLCIYFDTALPSGDPNLSTFYVMTGVFAAAAVWSVITYIRSNKKQ